MISVLGADRKYSYMVRRRRNRKQSKKWTHMLQRLDDRCLSLFSPWLTGSLFSPCLTGSLFSPCLTGSLFSPCLMWPQSADEQCYRSWTGGLLHDLVCCNEKYWCWFGDAGTDQAMQELVWLCRCWLAHAGTVAA